MTYYAFINSNNVVVEIIAGTDNETIEGIDPATWYGNFRGLICKKTFIDDPLKQYAGIGMCYDGADFTLCPYEGAEWNGSAWVPTQEYQAAAAALIVEALEDEII